MVPFCFEQAASKQLQPFAKKYLKKYLKETLKKFCCYKK
jgi:hypothetical protein